ncbi:MAG TPA: hypothetical protein VK997_04765 [Deferrisomatales bacterium]|nr:hypothetical protein [Deferrisomatales bacterium]
MSSGWGCPHEIDGRCRRRGDEECDPGVKDCVLEEGLRRAAEALHPDGPKPKSGETAAKSVRRRQS